MAEVGRDNGLILHGAAKTDAGLLVVNVWPSKAGSEAAARDARRLAVLQESRIHPGETGVSTTSLRSCSSLRD